MSTPAHIRRLVRESVTAVLADPVTGFNPRIQEITRNFPGNISATVDFTPDSPIGRNFIQAHLEPSEEGDNLPFFNALGKSPVTIVLFTRDMAGVPGAERCGRATRSVEAVIDVYAQAISSVTSDYERMIRDFENWMDAVEQAVDDAVSDEVAAWTDGYFPLPSSYRSERDPVVPFSVGKNDQGYIQRTRATLSFEV